LDSDGGGVAALAVFGIFILPVVGWIVVRYLAHRERMEMIRNGITPPPGRMRGREWRNSQNFGPPPGMPNMPNMPGPAMSKKSCDDDDFSLAAQRIVLRRGIRLTFIGLALTIGLSFIGYADGPLVVARWVDPAFHRTFASHECDARRCDARTRDVWGRPWSAVPRPAV
jgi:hypothetical protein